MLASRRSDLQEAFFVPGSCAFRVCGYGTTDPLEQVLAPRYFGHGTGLLRPGDLIYVSMRPPEIRGGAAPGEARMALVMVRTDQRNPGRAAGAVRLVQDFGYLDDPPGMLAAALPPAPHCQPALPKRGRGRPPRQQEQEPATTWATVGKVRVVCRGARWSTR